MTRAEQKLLLLKAHAEIQLLQIKEQEIENTVYSLLGFDVNSHKAETIFDFLYNNCNEKYFDIDNLIDNINPDEPEGEECQTLTAN